MGGLTGIHAAIRFRELMRDLLSFVRISGASPEPGVSARRQTYNLSSRVLETEREIWATPAEQEAPHQYL